MRAGIRFGATFTLLIGLLQPCVCMADAPVKIELRSKVQVWNDFVTLGDVAVLSAPDLTRLQNLMSLPLGHVPLNGENITLERDILMRWIQARTGIRPQEINWTGTPSCEVHLAVRNLEGDMIAASAREYLLDWLKSRGMRAELRLNRSPRDVTTPIGEVGIKVRPLPEGLPLSKRMVVWIELFGSDGRFLRAVPVGFEVSAYAPGYVAIGDMAIGRQLSETDLTVKELEWAARGALPESPTGRVLRLRRPLVAGEPLTRAHIEAVPSVSRAQWATLRMSKGLVNLESRVEVLQDGQPGDTVRVRLPKATGAILARVIGAGTLEILE